MGANYEQRKVGELREIAKKRGIVGYSKLPKASLIEWLRRPTQHSKRHISRTSCSKSVKKRACSGNPSCSWTVGKGCGPNSVPRYGRTRKGMDSPEVLPHYGPLGKEAAMYWRG